MKRWLRWSFLASVLAMDPSVLWPNGDPQPRSALVSYTSPPESVTHGDFAFQYPPELVVQQDFVYSDATVGPAHVVVLRHRDSEIGDLRSIEINMLRSLKQRYVCGDYEVCQVVDGVVIGTNSKDEAFQKSFETVVRSFKSKR